LRFPAQPNPGQCAATAIDDQVLAGNGPCSICAIGWDVFQRIKTWKASRDPRYREKKARIDHLYAIADREAAPELEDPEIVFCVDEFGPLNLQPRPGRQWAAVGSKGKEPGHAPRPRMHATYTHTAGVRHLLAAYELGEDKLFGHVKPRKTRARLTARR
jgi:hypothetical protein